MLNFPTFPDTLSTRQLECICCQEVFTVAEDFATVTGRPTPDWRLVPDQSANTALRYQPERSRRSVTPSMRAASDRNPDEFLDWEHSARTLVNCPRCGTDNRNWLQIQRLPRPWPQRLGWAGLGYLAPLILGVMVLVNFLNNEDIGASHLILLLVSISLAAHIPITSISRQWRKLREHHFAQSHVQSQSFWQSLPPPLRTGLISTGAFLVVIPFLLYILIPWSFDAAVNILASSSRENLALKIDSLITTLNDLPDDLQAENSEQIQSAIGDLNQIVRKLRPAEESGELPEWVPVSREFLKTWATHVLASSVVGIALGWMAAASYERKIRPHLPRPLYYSIAAMTRVVVWEAKQALEISDDVNRIQWTGVQRNRQGGITLQGLYRHESAGDQTGDPLNTRVLAQTYEIDSDRWGHIKKATVRSARVFQRPRSLRQVDVGLGDELFAPARIQAAEKERP